MPIGNIQGLHCIKCLADAIDHVPVTHHPESVLDTVIGNHVDLGIRFGNTGKHCIDLRGRRIGEQYRASLGIECLDLFGIDRVVRNGRTRRA